MQPECNSQRTQASSPLHSTTTTTTTTTTARDSTLDRNMHSPVSIDQQQQQQQQQMNKQQQQHQRRMGVDARSSLSHSDTMSAAGVGTVNTGIPGAAFNTTPIYDAQGSLVGLQAPVESGHPLDEYNAERTDQMNYMGMSPLYPYNMSPQPGGQMLPVEYYPYTNYSMNQPHGAYSPSFAPAHHHSQEQHYHHLLQHQQQQQQQQQHQQQQQQQQHAHHHEQQQKLLLADTTGNGTATIIRGLPKQRLSFDKCPTVCSLFAVLCCPITVWCSLPALIYSLCAYTDYRARDLERYQRKSDIARHLVITACVIGLLLCVTWAVLAFFYYAVIIATIHDVMRVINHRLGMGT
ncbi:putative transcript [Fasciola gigantica]|uniref:Putative transcript n=1 Tax=Fasciola gigantica TaxID=46835 RepID=A0A504YUG0_FASGI|nr:putative transcript [Fasciola gigantica]